MVINKSIKIKLRFIWSFFFSFLIIGWNNYMGNFEGIELKDMIGMFNEIHDIDTEARILGRHIRKVFLFTIAERIPPLTN